MSSWWEKIETYQSLIGKIYSEDGLQGSYKPRSVTKTEGSTQELHHHSKQNFSIPSQSQDVFSSAIKRNKDIN